MKRTLLLFAAIAAFSAACQNKTAEQKIDSLATSPDTTAAKDQSCYSYIKNRDTVSLSFIAAGNAIAGNLTYNLYEKDKNSGTIAGLIKGDTLLIDYTFNSEGSTSYRQEVFLKKGDQLLEGTGPTIEKDGKTVFDKTRLKFGESITLSKTNCQ